MNKSVSKFLSIALPLALGVFLIWYIFNKFSAEQLDELVFHFKSANYGYVILSVVLSVLSHFIRAYRWNFLLQPLGYFPKLANNFMAVSVAYLMNLFIPKSGEVSRALVLTKYEDVPFDKGFGTVISERIIDLVLLLFFIGLSLALQFDVLYAYLVEVVPVKKLLLILGAAVLLLLVFIGFLKYSKSKLSVKINTLISGLKEGILSIAHMKKKGQFIFWSVTIWILYLASFYVATQALDATSNISLGIIITTFVVGSFTFGFTNSGFGTYPAAIMGILLIFGIAETVGTALGWIVWTSHMIYIIASGGISFLALPFYNRHKTTAKG
ncbi:flippase-like domain-containing protein [Rasiella rasia]|uniref:Flippase-like domain-containing protein n=1 Tax=Rasiella rasia TaxID=2744027 RepID=A0A6G6GMD7_9FLAO|nr:lysylphosphatidylglycerol synthase transmembrane domain-containing protein [Rasiella rasia]QIE59573.1 flippase-like domain-containing protein [Rasiella rasia]